VFATAREKARQISCLSNIKQMGTAAMMYNQDYDELMPLFFTPDGPDRKVQPRSAWPARLQPYIKSWMAFKCPNMPDAIYTNGSGPPLAGTSIWGPQNVRYVSLWEGYGWNVDYLNFSADCSDYSTDTGSGPPTPLARIAKPAETVMIVGSALAEGEGSFMGANSLYPRLGGY